VLAPGIIGGPNRTLHGRVTACALTTYLYSLLLQKRDISRGVFLAVGMRRHGSYICGSGICGSGISLGRRRISHTYVHRQRGLLGERPGIWHGSWRSRDLTDVERYSNRHRCGRELWAVGGMRESRSRAHRLGQVFCSVMARHPIVPSMIPSIWCSLAPCIG
jgi:hypothetical protein